MIDDVAESETLSPGDEYERKLAQQQRTTVRDFKGITCVFFGFHALAFAILLCSGLSLDGLAFIEALVGAVIVAWLASAALALLQFVVAIRNALVLRWWMIALGVLPWMIIATEALLVFVVIIL